MLIDACNFCGMSLRAAPRIYWLLQIAPEEIAALYTLLLDEWLGCLTAADIVMDGGVIASGVSGLFR